MTMILLKHLFVLVSVLALSGCQSPPSVKLDPRDLVYSGPIQQFTVPYLLRYEATADVNVAVTILSKDLDDKRVDQFVKGRHKISQVGEQRLWEIFVEEMKENAHVTRSSTPPLFSMRMLLPPRGPVEHVDIDFPAYRAAGAKDIPDRSSSVYKAMEMTIKQSSLRLPETGVRVGDELYSQDDWVTGIFASVGPAELSTRFKAALRSNTLSSRIVGQTLRNGRVCLVATHSGSLEFALGDTSAQLATSGYSLVDVRSAIVAFRLFEVTTIVRNKGTVKTGEWLTRVDATF